MLRRAILLFIGAAFLFLAPAAFAQNPTPRPTRLPTPLPGGAMLPTWMTPPARGTTQADAGAVIYYERCMACHGDQGQGLTIEWRAQWDVEHQNCAKSTCHGARHPSEGFQFPKNFAPAIVGANSLTRFENAQGLFDFVSARMPFQAPGTLTRAEYWELVAYLLQKRGVRVARVDETNAPHIALHATIDRVAWLAGTAFGALCLVGTLVVLRRLFQK